MTHLSLGTCRRLLAAAAALAALAGVRPAAAAIKIDPREIMRVSEVRPGMRGVGRTVFQGTKIETFDVVVLGVLPKENLGRPLILVRMSGGPIVKRAANIIGGMSGSPVYINGRMAGAVAYGQTFPREPIAMLTPIEDMLEALDPALPGKPSWASQKRASAAPFLAAPAAPGERELDAPLQVNGQTYDRVAFTSSAYPAAGARRRRPGTLEMAPLATPAMVSGISPRSLDRLSKVFAPFGVEPMAGPGAMKHNKTIRLEPGSAVGASLVVGDVDMTAVGTVTYRKGNQVLAFGHPFMQMGAVDLPLTTAWVHDVFPSIQRSFKIASPVQIVGSVRQDRPWGIGGTVGLQPDMIPLVTTIRDFGTGRKQTLHARVIDNRFLTPQLIAMVTNEGIFRVRSVPGDATARVHTTIVTDKLGTIERDNLYYDALGIDSASLGDLLLAMGMLSSNPWERVSIRGVKVDVQIDSARRTATIERAVVDRDKYEPGDTVNIEVTLRPWEKAPVKRTLTIKIPEYAPNGRVNLRVQGGAGGGMMMAPPQDAGGQGGAVIRMAPAPLPPATSLQQLVQNYREKERNDELVAKLSLPTFTANIDGQKMEAVPPALLNVMRNPRNSALRLQNDEVKASLVTPWVVSGMAVVSLAIERQSFAEKGGSPSAGPPAPPSGPAPDGAGAKPAFAEDLSGGDDFGGDEIGMALPGLSRTAGAAAGRLPLIEPAVPTGSQAAGERPAQGGDAKLPPTPAGAAAKDSGDGADSGSQPKKPEVEAAAPVKAAGRSPQVWRQDTTEAFERGRLEGVAVSTRGEVTLAPALRRALSVDATYVWSLLATKGALYAGTGDHGVLYRIEGDKAKPVLESGELQVLALAADAAGNVYAGTAPKGTVYRITPDGKSKVFWRGPEQYILSLAVDAAGNVYAGTSPHGGVYRITPEGKGALLGRIPDPYVVSLAMVGGDVFAGSGTSAGVFRIAPDGKVATLSDPAEGNTASLVAAGEKGSLYVATSPRGTIYRVDSSGHSRVLLEKAPAGISALAVDGQGIVWAASGNSVYRVVDGDTPQVEKNQQPTGPRFLALAVGGDGQVAAGTVTGEVYRMAPTTATSGHFDSAVRDAGSVARWGRLTWQARTPAGTRIAVQTRTGNSEEPDATWSPWSAEQAQSGAGVASPAGRYFQYRAILSSDKADVRPVLDAVAVVYLPQNQKPKVTVSAPKGGDVWAKKQTIRWSGADADKDTLLYDVYYSPDGGAAWTRIKRIVKPKEASANSGGAAAPAAPGAKPEGTPGGAAVAPVAPAPAAVTPPAGAAKGGPASLPVALAEVAQAPAAVVTPPAPATGAAKAPGNPAQEPAKAKSESMKETSLSWDTAELPDGRYLVKVVASDRLSNPADPRTVEEIVGPISISNAVPKLALEGEPAADGQGRATVAGSATAGVPIAGVDYRVDEEEWASAAAGDGIFDSETERFQVTTGPLDKGEHTIEVRAVDAAGNQFVEKRKVTVR